MDNEMDAMQATIMQLQQRIKLAEGKHQQEQMSIWNIFYFFFYNKSFI